VVAAPVSTDGRSVDGILGGVVTHAAAADATPLADAPARTHGPLIFAIGSSQPFAARVCARLGVEPAEVEERTFEDGEQKIRPLVNVRNRHAYVIHSLHGEEGRTANDKLCRMLFLVGALKDAAAAGVTAVVPYLCYARKDRQTKPRDPVTTRYVAQLFEAVGTDRVIAMEVHNPAAFQNAFRCDTDHLDANALFADHFVRQVGDRPVAVVSPDPGGVKRADLFRQELEARLGRPVSSGFMEKHRSMGKVTGEIFAADVAGREVVVIDDLISTGGTMARMASACRAHGAARVHVAATHGLFSEGAGRILGVAEIDQIVITDTVIPPRAEVQLLEDRLVILGVADILAGAIHACHTGESIEEFLASR
jgi:ribose-phosphate pyrophosphokinase